MIEHIPQQINQLRDRITEFKEQGYKVILHQSINDSDYRFTTENKLSKTIHIYSNYTLQEIYNLLDLVETTILKDRLMNSISDLCEVI